MAESETTETTEIKTAEDLQLEQLNKRLDNIEANYQQRIKELEEANRGLWAQLHPAVEEPNPTAPAPTEPETDPGEQALYDALGLK